MANECEHQYITWGQGSLTVRICRQCGEPDWKDFTQQRNIAVIDAVTGTRNAMIEAQAIAERSESASHRPAPMLRVTYHDRTDRVFDLEQAGIWRVNTAQQMLVIGHGVPRIQIPLINIREFGLEERA